MKDYLFVRTVLKYRIILTQYTTSLTNDLTEIEIFEVFVLIIIYYTHI